ncbi:MAG: hypothetical protein QF724_02615, partial [Planctomycetota bacterium]|nr:hypothetical protein [Planctomycetota bacterium]
QARRHGKAHEQNQQTAPEGSTQGQRHGADCLPPTLPRPQLARGQLLAGTTWYFQTWFRDPWAGGAGFNLSDTAGISLVP